MKISNILLEWYKKNARDLPWRQNKNPYAIWISEIILQQTRVNQGLSYYNRFIDYFPDVVSLSNAKEEEVLKFWQGLGYYSRGRNLLIAAKQIVSEFNGELPDNFRQLKTLKGIGDYTAAAIASIAFNEPVAVVDGNVSRVLSRIYGIDIPINSSEGRKKIQSLADEVLDKESPGNSNQALMEFGALLCKPQNPDCDICPVYTFCKSYADDTIDQIPIKIARKSVKIRWFNYFIISNNDSVYIQKRVNEDIWKSLFQFPLIETSAETPAEMILEEFIHMIKKDIENFRLSTVSEFISHQLTHQKIMARFFHIELPQSIIPSPEEWLKINWNELDNYPIPRLIDRYLEQL